IGFCIDSEPVPMAYDVWGPMDRERPEDLDNAWEVHFYPSLSEMFGGPNDGGGIFPEMTVDISALLIVFDDGLDSLAWTGRKKKPARRYDAAMFELRGWYMRHPVQLRIFDEPPEDATIDTVLEHRTGRYRPKEPPQP